MSRFFRWAACCLIAAAVCQLTPGALQADDFPAPSLEEIDPAGIQGTLLICGGGKMPAEVMERFVELAGGSAGRLVVIPTASEKVQESEFASLIQIWRDRGIGEVHVLHTRDRDTASSAEFVAPLQNCTAVWISGGLQSLLAKAYVGTLVEQELTQLLKRGGVIGGSSAGAAIQSRLMIASGFPRANLARGLDLLPGAVIDQHFKARNRQQRLTTTLDEHPGYFGIGIDEGTAALVRGHVIEVLGDSTVTVILSGTVSDPSPSITELDAGKTTDLTELRRAAIQRAGR